MTEPVRVLHFADAHIGVESYGGTDPKTGLNVRVRDFLRRMDEMIDYARDHQVDLTIFAGDAFKTRTPNPTYQREFAWRIIELARLAPVVLLTGNHDMQPARMKASSIEIYHVLAVPNVWLADDYKGRVFETRRGAVYVGAAPYPMRTRLLDAIASDGIRTIADTDALMVRELITELERLAAEADHHPLPRLLTGHFAVDGATEGSEKLIKFGRDILVPRSVIADQRWDYVALGHIHQHQNLTHGRAGVPPVVYSGSLERIDFSEEREVKGFCWVELARGRTMYQFHRLRARPFRTIRLDLRASDDPTCDAVSAVEEEHLDDAVVRVLLTLTPETNARLNIGMVRDALVRGGTGYIATIRCEVEQPARARLGAKAEELSDLELVERYLMSKDTPATRRAALLAAAEALFTPHDDE